MNRRAATRNTALNTQFHAAAARSRGLAAADGSKQFCTVEAADMPAPCFARLRHVVNNRDVICNSALSVAVGQRLVHQTHFVLDTPG